MDREVIRLQNKMKAAVSMTELLTAMAAYQSYVQSHDVSQEDIGATEEIYLKAETRLLTNIKSTPW